MKVFLLEVSFKNFILGISKEVKWKVKVVLLQVLLIVLIPRVTKGDQMEGESGVTRSIFDEFYSWDI